MIPHINDPDGLMVRNRDSWRIATLVATTELGYVIVQHGDGVDVWPERDVQPIAPEDLDRALMWLRFHPAKEVYPEFLDIMLGETP